ncbi:cyclin-dependent kinase-like 2 isoform X2 [Littorina saxatilis]
MHRSGGAGDGGMEKYENLGLVGEGSYGMVLKCRHKDTSQLVAIKKFLESEDDKMVKKIAMREVKMLKQLRHDHLVNLIEVFRRKKRLYLVFEFVDHTVLDELEKCPNGLDENTCRKILWQVLKGTEFCHTHHIIHRDIKPENILVSKQGIVKICDFGFARTLAQTGEAYTDYVATRWYRAPELLVGDTKYGKAVDIWAVGCLLSEMLTGEPLFPGDSDIDQLYHIVKCFGNLTQRHREVFLRNPLFVGMRIPEVREIQPLERKFTKVSPEALDFMKQCLRLDPDNRPTCTELLKHSLFGRDGFGCRYPIELKHKIQKENANNPLYKSPSTNLDSSESDNRDAEGTSKMGLGAGIKKKKKDTSSTTFTNKKESTFYSSSKKDGDDKKKRAVLVSTGSNDATASSTPVNDNERRSPSKKHSPPVVNGSSVSFPPAIIVSFKEQDSTERERSDEKKGHQGTPSSSPQATTSIPPINHSGQTITPSSMQGSSPSILNSTSTHLAYSSFPHNLSPSNALFATHHYRVSPDKAMPQKKPSFGRKPNTSSPSCSINISPQPMLLTEKSSMQDKILQGVERNKFKYPERSQQGGVCLPEVKVSRSKRETIPMKKSTVSSIPHITNIDPFSTNNSQMDNYSDEDGLPTVT